jgi:hypothetical protein
MALGALLLGGCGPPLVHLIRASAGKYVKMTLRRAYAPMLPQFDGFLFASVGEEVDGMPLSVLSALSQLGLDPRDEAARLAHLTKEAAAEQLARMIAGLSGRRWSVSEAQRIASGLIERLPTPNAARKDDRGGKGNKPVTSFKASSLLMCLALVLALLVSLVAGGYLSFGG